MKDEYIKNIFKNLSKDYYRDVDFGEEYYSYNYTKKSYDKHKVSIGDVIKVFSAEQLIEAIGIDKVDLILRKKKLEKLKLKIK